MTLLSKSRFMAGWQCPLRLWYAAHRPDLAPPPDEALQAVFDTGHEVGRFARERYSGGVLVDCDYRDVEQAVHITRELMADSNIPAIYEAAIVHEGALTRVDILARNGSGWDLIEVKSSTREKEHFVVDVAMQYWILVSAGIEIRHAGLLVLNREYVYPGGPHDLNALFRFEDLTSQCADQLTEIGKQVQEYREIIRLPDPPEIEIGDHCHSPYECPFWAHCSRDIDQPPHPISEIPNLNRQRRAALAELGIETIADIPEDYPLTPSQERVRAATVSGQPWSSFELQDALNEVQWPLFHLDFEAVTEAIPRFPGMRPYDALPFQFSCHIQTEPGSPLEHHEFLATDTDDPRETLARHLLDTLGESGSIVVYSSYEKSTIRRLAAWLPHLGESLLNLETRLFDLLKVIKDHYYHPDFEGSYSIKQVLPVMTDLTYDDMEVADGIMAGIAWKTMLSSEDVDERRRLDHALRAYCHKDTLAMAHLYEALLSQS